MFGFNSCFFFSCLIEVSDPRCPMYLLLKGKLDQVNINQETYHYVKLANLDKMLKG